MGFDIGELMSKDKKVIRDIDIPAKKQGRPKKDVTKNSIVTTYLTKEEKEKLQQTAENKGLTIANYVRNLILRELNLTQNHRQI